MRLRSFEARSMADALQEMRRMLGEQDVVGSSPISSTKHLDRLTEPAWL